LRIRNRARLALSLAASVVALAGLMVTSSSVPASAASASSRPLIFIDPGHGGPLSNANANGLKEKNVNLAVALELRRVLLKRGYRVQMSRQTDRAVNYGDTPTWNYDATSEYWHFTADGRSDLRRALPKDDLTARVNAANAAGADLFICIHNNGARNRSARGTESYASRRDALGRQLLAYVQPEVVRHSGFKNRGTHLTDFYVCRWSNMPAVLVEGAFISNKYDAARLKSPWVRRGIATGIADGIGSWFARKPVRPVYPRISAETPVALSLAISRLDFPTDSSAAVVVRADAAASVSGAATLAARLGGPLLLTEGSAPSTETADEIARLSPDRVVFVGSNAAFDTTACASVLASSGVETSTVSSVTATDSAQLAADIAELSGISSSRDVALVRAGDTRAALVLSTIAARTGTPVLIASADGTGPAADFIARHRSQISRVLLLSSTSKSPLSPDPSIRARVIRASRPEQMALLLSVPAYPTVATSRMRPVVVDPQQPADVLVAASHGAHLGQPVLQMSGTVMSPYTREFITNRRSQIGGFQLLSEAGSLNKPALDWMLVKADRL